MANPSLCHIVQPRGDQHTHTVILLHGRDSTAEEFAGEFFESEASEPANGPRTLKDLFPSTRWVFPGAPELPSSRFEMPMPQWFDMWSTENPQERSDLQRSGLRQSVAIIREIIRQEEAIVPRSHIFLGGISQGFATALATFFADESGGFAGLIGFCGWMPLLKEVQQRMGRQRSLSGMSRIHQALSETFAGRYSSLNIDTTPIFAAHAWNDEVINYRHGETMYKMLMGAAIQVDWHLYKDGGHWINEPQGIDDLAAFLQLRMQSPQ